MGNVISQDDLLTLKENYSLYQTASRSGFVKNYSIQVYRSLLGLYNKYVSSVHSFSHWCGDCRFDLVLRLYQWANSQEEFVNLINEVTPEPEVVNETELPIIQTPENLPISELKDNAVVELKKKRGRPKKN